MTIKLGSKVRDTITGFTGIATSRAEYLYGCVQIGVQPTELHEGSPISVEYFDDQRIEVIAEQQPAVSAASSATSGGPQSHPPARR